MPELIKNTVLSVGIKNQDIELLKEWGKFLSEDTRNETISRDGKRRTETKTKLTTSQIRKFFGEIKRIQADFENCKGDIILLDPKIAYAVGRAEGQSKIEDFYRLTSPLIFDIQEVKVKFKNFVTIIEAIVAYHKAAGGK